MEPMSLYAISAQYQQAFMRLADSELDEQTIADTLEGLEGEIEDKAINVAAFIRNLEASASAIKDAELQMYHRRKSMEAKAERMRDYLKSNLDACGMSAVECPQFAIKIRRNPPSVVIDDASRIPAEYMVQPEIPAPYPDKKALAQALKAAPVDGARLESGTRLEIR